MSLTDTYIAHFRGGILKMLDAANGECSLALIRSALAESTMHDTDMDTLTRELTWLADRSLVSQRKIDGHIEGVVISARGVDVANGRRSVLGVDVGD